VRIRHCPTKKVGRINIPFDKDTRINLPFSFNSLNNVELITLVLLELMAKINQNYRGYGL